MPRTAETSRRQSDQRTGTRSSDPRLGELARTPVLFRLPTIELDLAAAALRDDEADSTGDPESDLELAGQPQPANTGQIASSDHLPPDGSRDDSETVATDSRASHGPASAEEPPMVRIQNSEQPAVNQALVNPQFADLGEATSAADAQNVLSQSSLSQHSGSQASVTKRSDTNTLAQPLDEPERSWWDHWSSGVVLILLIIALITASIIAFNDKSESDPDLVVHQSEADAASESEFDLANIQIPDVKEAMQAEIVTGRPVASSVAAGSEKTVGSEAKAGDQSSAESRMQLTSTAKGQTNMPSASLQQPSASDSKVSAAGDEQYSGLIPESLAPLGGNAASDVSQPAAAAKNSGSSTSSSSNAQLASGQPNQSSSEGSSLQQPPIQSELMQPVAQEKPGLFPELPIPKLSTDQDPDLGASMSSVQPVKPSAVTGEQSGVRSTNLPAYGELLNTTAGGTTSGQTVSGNANQATFSTAGLKNAESAGAGSAVPNSASTQVAGGAVTSANAAGESASPSSTRPIPTATPNQDPDAIIRAYQYYIQMAGEASDANRYGTSPQQAP